MGERNLFPWQGSDGRLSTEEQPSSGGRKSNSPGFLFQIPLPGGGRAHPRWPQALFGRGSHTRAARRLPERATLPTPSAAAFCSARQGSARSDGQHSPAPTSTAGAAASSLTMHPRLLAHASNNLQPFPKFDLKLEQGAGWCLGSPWRCCEPRGTTTCVSYSKGAAEQPTRPVSPSP